VRLHARARHAPPLALSNLTGLEVESYDLPEMGMGDDFVPSHLGSDVRIRTTGRRRCPPLVALRRHAKQIRPRPAEIVILDDDKLVARAGNLGCCEGRIASNFHPR
jgi:hypothetical protein